MAELATQSTVGVKEASKIAGVSTKQIRSWIKEGRVRADLKKSRYGMTYFIEASSIPVDYVTLEQGQAELEQGEQGQQGKVISSAGRLETRVMEGLMGMLKDTQGKLEGATTRLGQLEGAEERVLALTADAESLRDKNERMTTELADTRAKAQILEAQQLTLKEKASQVDVLNSELEQIKMSFELTDRARNTSLIVSIICMAGLVGLAVWMVING